MSRLLTLNTGVQLRTESCCACGILFAMPEARYEEARRRRGPNGAVFCCPNGHRQWYTGDNAEEALRRERDRLAQQVAERDDDLRRAERQQAALRGELTKLKKRATNGVCPCCTRSFSNLRNHMKTKHPDFAAESTAKEKTA